MIFLFLMHLFLSYKKYIFEKFRCKFGNIDKNMTDQMFVDAFFLIF